MVNSQPGTSPSRRRSLRVESGPSKGQTITIPSEGLILGRDAQTPQIATDSMLSRKHARIDVGTNGSLQLRDLGSSNGTSINGRKVDGVAGVVDGDQIRLGNTTLVCLAREGRPDGLAEAKQLLAQGKIRDGKAILDEAINNEEIAPEAHYLLGLLSMRNRNFAEARANFALSADLDAAQGNAHFQLGVIAEESGDEESSIFWYQKALAVNPAHAGARAKLARLDLTSAGVKVPHPENKARDVAAPYLGRSRAAADSDSLSLDPSILDFLRRDNSAISKQAATLIEQLNMEARPHFTAYFGLYVGRVVLLALIGGFGVGFLFALADWEFGSLVMFAVATLLFLIIELAMIWLVASCTLYTVSNGRLQIARGLFHRSRENFDLWRILNVTMDQTLVNRLTRDGTLTLTMPSSQNPVGRRAMVQENTVRVTGLAKAPELDDLQQRLLNLSFLLRGNPVVKGIVQ